MLICGAVTVTVPRPRRDRRLVDVMMREAGEAHLSIRKPLEPSGSSRGPVSSSARRSSAIWYWCTDQFIVQRVLAAKNETEARRGADIRRIPEVLPLFIFVLPGLIAAAPSAEGRTGAADSAFPALVAAPVAGRLRVSSRRDARRPHELPCVGVQLVLDAAHLGRLPQAPAGRDREATGRVGRASTVAACRARTPWIPLHEVDLAAALYLLQSVQAYIAPPIAACVPTGILSKRVQCAARWRRC